MNQYKFSYFQGGGGENEPTPKKKKYKDEPVDQNLTKARGVFFQNYDLYDTGGPSPGTGLYQHMNEYDSVEDFRKKKRKEKMRKRRQALFEAIMVSTASNSKDSNNLTDPTEDTVTPLVWNSAEPGGSQIGMLDGILPEESLIDTPRENLYYGTNDIRYVDDKKK